MDAIWVSVVYWFLAVLITLLLSAVPALLAWLILRIRGKRPGARGKKALLYASLGVMLLILGTLGTLAASPMIDIPEELASYVTQEDVLSSARDLTGLYGNGFLPNVAARLTVESADATGFQVRVDYLYAGWYRYRWNAPGDAGAGRELIANFLVPQHPPN